MKAEDALGWLVDRAGSMDEALAAAWELASGDGGEDGRRPVEEGVPAYLDQLCVTQDS